MADKYNRNDGTAQEIDCSNIPTLSGRIFRAQI